MLTVVTRKGVTFQIEGRPGASVMEILRESGFDELRALCWGCCFCGTCHVYVDSDWFNRLPNMTVAEERLLDGSVHRKRTSRLSCQLTFQAELNGMKIEIAPED